MSSSAVPKTKIRKRFGPPRGGDNKIVTSSAQRPVQQQYTEREMLMLQGVDWRALVYLVAFPVLGAGLWVLCSEEAQQQMRDDPNLATNIRSRMWYREEILERKKLRDEKRAKRQEEEKAQREQEIYEQEKQKLIDVAALQAYPESSIVELQGIGENAVHFENDGDIEKQDGNATV